MERRDKQQAEATILDAVISCKYEESGSDIQITQVAAKAGISTRTLNRYFPDKEKMIYLAAIRFLERKYSKMSELCAIARANEMNGMERIRLLLEMHAEYYRANPLDAMMVDSANLRYTLGSLEVDYPKIQIGLELRRLFIADMELGQRDGSIRPDLDIHNTWVMLAATYHGLLHRLAYLNSTKCESIDRETFFKIYADYINMFEKYLSAQQL